MTTGTIKDQLRDNTFLGGLPEEALERICRNGRTGRFRKGETIFRRGDEGTRMMLILSGTVKVFNTSADGREAVLNFLGPGDVIGEFTMLDGLDRAASVVTLEAAETFVLQRRDIVPALLAHPDTMLEIIQTLCGKLRSTSAVLEDSLNEMPGRTARGLLRLADQHGRKTKEGIVINLQVSQRDLGGYMGLSRENTSRQLASLRRQGLIAMDAARIVILDRPGLERSALEQSALEQPAHEQPAPEQPALEQSTGAGDANEA